MKGTIQKYRQFLTNHGSFNYTTIVGRFEWYSRQCCIPKGTPSCPCTRLQNASHLRHNKQTTSWDTGTLTRVLLWLAPVSQQDLLAHRDLFISCLLGDTNIASKLLLYAWRRQNKNLWIIDLGEISDEHLYEDWSTVVTLYRGIPYETRILTISWGLQSIVQNAYSKFKYTHFHYQLLW
jgi:hypothetical protein